MKGIMKKVNEFLDSPWTLRRSLKWSVVWMVAYAIAYGILCGDAICEWYEEKKRKHFKDSWGDLFKDVSDED